MTLNDTKLKAYLDNELTAPERAQVEQALTTSPAAQERLAALQAQQAAVTARLDALTPTGAEQSPTRLALRRLRSTLTADRQATDNGLAGDSLSVWEAPSLGTQFKQGLRRLWPGRPGGGFFGRGLGRVVSFALLLLAIGATIILWPTVKQQIAQPETPIARPDKATPAAQGEGTPGRILFGVSNNDFAKVKTGLYTLDPDGTNLTQITETGPTDNVTATYAADRQQLALSLSGVSGRNDIYVMNSDGSNRINLTDSDAYDFFPVWSPDQTQLAYLSMIESDDETVTSDLYIIDADGTNRRRLTDDEPRIFHHTWSPDGQHLAFIADDDGQNHLYVSDAAGTKLTRLTDREAHFPDWSPDGTRLLFFNEGTIYTIQADGTDVTPLPSDAHYSFVNLRAVWSPTGRKIAFTATGPNADGIRVNTALFVVQADGSDLTRLTVETLKVGLAFAWSPDGERLVFTAGRNGNDDLYVVNADGTNLRRLTDDSIGGISFVEWTTLPEIPSTTDASEPVVSRSKQQLLFEGPNGLTLTDAEGMAPVLLITPAENWITGGTWSPDGQQIAYVGQAGEKSEIYLMNADGTNWRRLTETEGTPFLPDWSPDGHYLTFSADHGDIPNIYVIAADGSNQHKLTSDDTSDVVPRWSPDGEKIVFASFREDAYDIYTINRDGTGLTRLTDQPEAEWHPVWSPSGQQIAFVAGSMNENGSIDAYDVYVMNSDGTNRRRLTNFAADDFRPGLAWSPDGKKLAFAVKSETRTDLYTVGVDGTDLTQVTTSVNVGFNFDWSAAGRRLAFSTYPNEQGRSDVFIVDADGTNLRRVTEAGGLGSVEWQPIPQQTADTMHVVVALQPIRQGEPFRAGSIGRRAWPAGQVPPGAIANESDVAGHVAAMDIVQGQVIVREMLSPTATISALTNIPLDQLVLQPEDLPADTTWQKSGPMILDDPANPLIHNPSFEASEVVENYHIFATVPLATPEDEREINVPVGNYVYRFQTTAQAMAQRAEILQRLQPDGTPGDTLGNPTPEPFITVTPYEEGGTVHWTVFLHHNLLALLMMDNGLPIIAPAPALESEFMELQSDAILTLRHRIEGRLPERSATTPRLLNPGQSQSVLIPLLSPSRIDSALGFEVSYPARWRRRFSEAMIIFAPSRDGLDPDAITGPTIWLGRVDPESEVLDLLEKHLNPAAGQVDQVEDTFFDSGDYPWTAVQGRLTPADGAEPTIATLAVTVRNGQGYFWLALAPAKKWNQVEPHFQEMLDSLEFSEPLDSLRQTLDEAVTNFETCAAVRQRVLTSDPAKCIAPSGHIFVDAPLTFEVLLDTLREMADG